MKHDEVVTAIVNEHGLKRVEAEKILATAVDTLSFNGKVIVKERDYDKLIHSFYHQYKLRRTALEMFDQHKEIRAYDNGHIPAATAAQMVEWQAVLNGEDGAE